MAVLNALATPPRRIAGVNWRSVGIPIALIVGAVAVWSAITAVVGATTIPYPWSIIATMIDDWPLLWDNTTSTLYTAVCGLFAAVVVTAVLGAVSFALPFSRPVVVSLATVVHVIPIAAVAPIVVVAAEPEMARIIVAALLVYFPLLIGVLLGLNSVDTRAMDVITASGGGSLAQLRRVRFASALPHIIAGLQIGVPAAVVGAMLGEFFGSEEGLGAILLVAQQQFFVNRVWAIGVLAGLIATAGFGLVTLVARIAVPWAGEDVTVGTSVAGGAGHRLGPAKTVLAAVASFVLIIGFWYSLRYVFGFDSYFVRTPDEVIRFMISGDPNGVAAASSLTDRGGPTGFWGSFRTALGQTIVHAAVGFVCGIVVAVLAAIMAVAAPSVGRPFTAVATVVRSIPLLAMTPVIVLVFGRGLIAVTVIIVLITFFPTMVNVIAGLRGAPATTGDVIRASGGRNVDVARYTQLLYSVPSIIASVRIAVPAAISGAMLAEWLATGDGVGYMIALASVHGQYLQLWTVSALMVVLVLILYGLLGAISAVISRRIGIAD
ncbi:ABC transporter permease [Gordonia sp. DT219]|uniref:ABC transporter permease n=1 Tax=Gordonia sp. DT219 TaxID=3416658 RepID=UPI003CF2A396